MEEKSQTEFKFQYHCCGSIWVKPSQSEPKYITKF